MADLLAVSAVRFTPAGQAERATGVLGYVRCQYGALLLDGLVLRRTRDARHVLAFPFRKDRLGHRHSYVRPAGSGVRAEIEEQVVAELRRQGALP